MSKWIELDNGSLVNLDNVSNINKYQIRKWDKDIYSIIFCYSYDSDCGYAEEVFDDETERDERYEEIKAMLLGGDRL